MVEEVGGDRECLSESVGNQINTLTVSVGNSSKECRLKYAYRCDGMVVRKIFNVPV